MAKAYVLINSVPGSEDFIISQLKSIESVIDAYGAFGPYDIIINLQTADDEKLKQVLSKRIRKVSKIQSTLTLITEKNDKFGKKLNKTERETLEKYSAHAYVMIQCEKSHEDNILSELAKIPEVIEADGLIGAFDIICRVVAPTYNDISGIVTKTIRKLEGIKTTTTLNVIMDQSYNASQILHTKFKNP